MSSVDARVAVSGTGFIARQLLQSLAGLSGLEVVSVLSRRSHAALADFSGRHLLVDSPDALVASADVVVECSGDPIHAATVVAAAFDRQLPVVTMNTEFHVTCGSAFVQQGWISEAEGDQPGCTAALARELRGMGFQPLVYGNMKGFLNHRPSPSEMAFWAQKQGISVQQVTAFTDGTKLQMEQALIANGCDLDILCRGLMGVVGSDPQASAMTLAAQSLSRGSAIADYVIDAGFPAGIFVVAGQGFAGEEVMRYLKMGSSPYYFERPFHLCALEIHKTIREALRGDPPLLNNGVRPAVSVLAVAKRELPKGCQIARGMGGFDVRGEAVLVSEAPDHVPIGILSNAELIRTVREGDYIGWDDVRLPDSLALKLVRQIFN